MEQKDWFVPKYIYSSTAESEYNRRGKTNKSFNVKFCSTCSRAYETFFYNCKSSYAYYEDFVTIGLERKICEKCNE